MDDYDRENPITADTAYDAWLTAIREANGEDAAGDIRNMMGGDGQKTGLASKLVSRK